MLARLLLQLAVREMMRHMLRMTTPTEIQASVLPVAADMINRAGVSERQWAGLRYSLTTARRTSSHVDACGHLRRRRWSSRWHVVQHWETVRFQSSPTGLETPYRGLRHVGRSGAYLRKFASFRASMKTYLFSWTFWYWHHASHWLCNVVLKRMQRSPREAREGRSF